MFVYRTFIQVNTNQNVCINIINTGR